MQHAIVISGETYVSRKFLLSIGVSKNTINDGQRRGNNSWLSVKSDGQVFFLLKSIPESTKGKYDLSENLVAKKTQIDYLSSLVKLQVSDLDYFKNLEFDIPESTCFIYYKQAGWFRILETLKKKANRYFLNSDGWKELTMFNNAEEIWESALLAMRLQNLIHHFKASTGKGLRSKVKNWASAQSEEDKLMSLVHGQYGNENRKVVGKSSNKVIDKVSGQVLPICPHEAIIYSLYMNHGQPNKLTFSDIYERYKFMIAEVGQEAVSFQTLCRHLGKFSTQLLGSAERHGYTHFMEKHNTYVPSSKPSASNVLVAADGSSVKMYYKYMDKSGKWQRANAYAVRIVDVYSECIIGFSLSNNETAKGVKDAIQTALKAGDYRPFGEFLSDNGSAFTGEDGRKVIEAVSATRRNISITKKTRNGYILHYSNKQSNPAEAFVKYLSNNARQFSNWIAVGMNAKKADNRTNADYMGKVEDLPDFDELKKQFIELIARFNMVEKNGQTRFERYKNGLKDEQKRISDRVLRYLFSEYRTEATINRGFLKIKKELYEIPDYEKFLPKIDKYGAKVSVVFSSDWAIADVYAGDDVFLTTIKLAKKTSKASTEQDGENSKALGHHIKRKRKLEKRADEFIESTQQAMQLLDEDYSLTAKFEQKMVKELSNALAEQKFLLDNRPAQEEEGKEEQGGDDSDFEFFNI